MQYLPLIAVFAPLVFAVLLLVFHGTDEKRHKILFVLGSAVAFVACAAMFPALRDGATLGTGSAVLSFPLTFSFRADGLGIFFAVIFSFSSLLANIYSLGYICHSHSPLRYFTLLLIFEASMTGIVLSASLVGIFIFFEMMTVSAYLLVIHEEDEEAMRAGAKFLYMSLGAGLAIFLGMAATYYLGGRLDFVPGGYISEVTPLAMLAMFAFLTGFGVKAGMFPVHIWLPDAHPVAPSPMSALLSGCSIKSGVYGIIRIIHFVYGVEAARAVSLDKVLMVLSVITILLGSALALQQDQIKRRLAYSSVAQIGYVLLGVSLLSRQAMFGALFHAFSHALMKGTLFFCAGAIIFRTENKYISKMKGIGFQMPVTMISFALAAVTMVGIPPFNAFISKWHLAAASLAAGQPFLVAVLIASSLLNALYYFPIVISAFFTENTVEGRKSLVADQIPPGMLWTTALLASACLVFAFTDPNWPVVLADQIAAAIF